MILFQSRVEWGQIDPILAEKLLVEEENRNFISELVEPLLITILLYINCFKGHFGKIDFTKLLKGVITEGAVILCEKS